MNASLPGWKDRALFTPGPLTTSNTVKQAMLRDLGSRDGEFIALVRQIREDLLALGEVSTQTHTTVLMQGSGTFGLESVLTSVLPHDGSGLLVISNGAYGERLAAIADRAKIPVRLLSFANDRPLDLTAIDDALASELKLTHIAVVHCETSTGLVNPVAAIAELAKRHQRQIIVDAMSSFGAIALPLHGVDYLVTSANKCLEGVPGFALAIARKTALEATAGLARSLSLDLYAQWRGLEDNGQFRFTPPTHAILALAQALAELRLEGGPPGRLQRYQANQRRLIAGMDALGFATYLSPELRGPIITAFRYPQDPRFSFPAFYAGLHKRGFVIYPGKVGEADCFRIGSIGRLDVNDVASLVAAIADTLEEFKICVRP